MSTEENKVLMGRFLAASVDSNEIAFKALLASDFVAHIPGGPANREAFVQHNNRYVAAFSDRQYDSPEKRLGAELAFFLELGTIRGTTFLPGVRLAHVSSE